MSLYRIARFSSLFFLLFLVCASPTRAQAQEPAPDSDANCITCHEHRYFLYDEGKYNPFPPSNPPPDLASVRWSSLGILNQAGLVLTAIGLILIGILAYRCWKADCLMKIG